VPGNSATQFYVYPTGNDRPCDAPVTFAKLVDQLDTALSKMETAIARAKNPPGCIIEYNAPASLPKIDSDIRFNTVITDSDGWFDPNRPTVLVLPEGAVYRVGLYCTFTDRADYTYASVGYGSGHDGNYQPGANNGADLHVSDSSLVRAYGTDGHGVLLSPKFFPNVGGTLDSRLKYARLWAFVVADNPPAI
jgi:hypothetical protein